ncbi:hypothetical protein [Rhodococcus sp. H29-C3]|uniref:hypothetical protein n=1 Tax=Rhodococcus sp. H29-C3 TaxID=3046307 RepID=UPI0024BA3971|nr:hypothetical protein [Rhodococcus sp. H29-C3]MDJ0360500.1 hypothetical protein [Rhodococcus sp. H29-C3]
MSMSPPGDGPAHRETRCWSTTSNSSFEPPEHGDRAGATTSSNAATPAILLFGFAGAYRRSELSDLVCGEVAVQRLDGLHIRLRKSETYHEGRGAVKALFYTDSRETCPPRADVRWAQVVAAYDAGDDRLPSDYAGNASSSAGMGAAGLLDCSG